MKQSTRWRIVAAISAAALFTNIIAVASTASNTSTVKGYCYNNAAYSLSLYRSGDTVITTFQVSKLPANSKWNVNYSFVPINKVANTQVKASKSGLFTLKRTIKSADPVTVYVFVDTAFASVLTCVAGATV